MITVTLSTRPRFYRAGDDLAAGTLRVVRLPDDQATIERRIGVQAWYPLTARSDPAWRLWSTVGEAEAEAFAEGAPLLDWPHWGQP